MKGPFDILEVPRTGSKNRFHLELEVLEPAAVPEPLKFFKVLRTAVLKNL
jgi:hypothetical protein